MRGFNADMEQKDFFEMGSKHLAFNYPGHAHPAAELFIYSCSLLCPEKRFEKESHIGQYEVSILKNIF